MCLVMQEILLLVSEVTLKTPILGLDRSRCRYHPFLSVTEGLKCSGCKNNNFHFLHFKVLQGMHIQKFGLKNEFLYCFKYLLILIKT